MSNAESSGLRSRRLRHGALLAAALLLLVFGWRGRTPEPRDWFAARARTLDDDPAKIRSYVDGLARHPYRGSLRGALGVMFAEGGNALDRGLLLRALLTAAGEAPEGEASEGAPADRHELEVELLLDGARRAPPACRVRYALPTLVDDPLVLSFPGDGVELRPLRAAGPALSVPGPAGGHRSLSLRLTHLRGGDVVRAVRREVFSDAYEGHRRLRGPADQHLIFVTTGRLRPEVYRRLASLYGPAEGPLEPGAWAPGARRAAFGQALARQALIAADHAQRSDLALDELCDELGLEASFVTPRILIASRLQSTELDARAAEARACGRELEAVAWGLDLRQNRVEFRVPEGGEAAADPRHAATVRGLYEAQLEGVILARHCGPEVRTALGAFEDSFEPRRSSLRARLATYLDGIEALLAGVRTGDRVAFARDPARTVELTRDAGGRVRVELSETLRSELEASGCAAPILRVGSFDRGQTLALALELELIFHRVAPAKDTAPAAVDWSRLTPRLLSRDVRIFYRKEVEGAERVTLEFQLLTDAAKGPLSYAVVDHWDELAGRPARRSSRLLIPARARAESRVISRWYNQDRYYQSDSHLIFSERMMRQLREDGVTRVSYRDVENRLSPPLDLYLCGRVERRVRVNNVERSVTVLQVGGGPAAEGRSKPESYDAVAPIYERFGEGGRFVTNRFEVLDDPELPLARLGDIQTAIPGRVVSARTGAGVEGCVIEVADAGSEATSRADGGFRLPVFEKPFGVFEVTARAPGYAPLARSVDFLDPEALPLELALEAQASEERFVWITAGSLDARLPQVQGARARELIRTAIEDDPALVALCPKRPVERGLRRVHPWLLMDSVSGHVTAATDDGLYSATRAWEYLTGSYSGGQLLQYTGATTTKDATHALNVLAGFDASWFLYGSGRLDALAKETRGGRVEDPHAQARAKALAFLASLKGSQTGGPLRGFVALNTGVDAEAFEQGFALGLRYFEQSEARRRATSPGGEAR